MRRNFLRKGGSSKRGATSASLLVAGCVTAILVVILLIISSLSNLISTPGSSTTLITLTQYNTQRPSSLSSTRSTLITSSSSSRLSSSSSSSFTIIIITTTLSAQSHTISSYSPPNHDTILLKNPCFWWCNANDYDRYILNYSAEFGVPDPMLIKAQIALESAFNATATKPNLKCGDTDDGLMQLNPKCNNVNSSLIFDPAYNIYWGVKYWSDDYYFLLQKWGDSCNTTLVLKATLELYNVGATAIGNNCGSFPLGTNYTSLVMKYYVPFSKNASYTPIL